MMNIGKPTGIMHEDINKRREVEFEGRIVQIYRATTDVRDDAPEGVVLELDTGVPRLALYGYFENDEFMEVGRERIG
jgi:hypothetical protein